MKIIPQDGKQMAFAAAGEDIVIYGGEVGGGKTFGLILIPLQFVRIPGFTAVTFRRETKQVRGPGGLWDQAMKVYPYVRGSHSRETDLDWSWPTGARVGFSHMEHESDRYNWDGSEIATIQFDQLESFTYDQFFYMLSRNRSTCGVRPFIRASCNPVPIEDKTGGWLREFLSWWIDEETGFAIPERDGAVRYMSRVGDVIEWGMSADEMRERVPGVDPLSVRFIKASIADNPILRKIDPGYMGRVDAMAYVDRERLKGNWNVGGKPGDWFKREWFEVVKATPMLVDEIRYWDRAGTEDDPRASWTVGLRLGKDERGRFYVVDVVRFQGTALTVQEKIKNIATQDGPRVRVGIEGDPGQAGLAEAQVHVRNLGELGFIVEVNTVHESKGNRAKPVSAQAEQGNVKILAGAWNETFFRETSLFDGIGEKILTDQVDALSGAYHLLSRPSRFSVAKARPKKTEGERDDSSRRRHHRRVGGLIS